MTTLGWEADIDRNLIPGSLVVNVEARLSDRPRGVRAC